MTHSIASDTPHRRVVVGVDTHKHIHVAVAVDTLGVRLEHRSFSADSADSAGYAELVDWAETHGCVEAFGIEGTGSYGAGLTSAVRRRSHRVVEVNRGDRRTRGPTPSPTRSTPRPPPGPFWPAPPPPSPRPPTATPR